MGVARSCVRGRAGWIPVAAVAVLFSGAGAASADEGTGAADREEGAQGGDVPALSIEVADGLDGMEPGEETEYTVTVRNDGDEAVEGLVVSQGVPPEMELVETDGERVGEPGGALDGLAVWEVDLDPGEEAVGRTKVRLEDPGEKLWRVAVTVCAQPGAQSPPLVCATDANLLPETPDAEPADPAEAAASTPRTGPPVDAGTGAVLAGLVVGVGIVYFLWRRRTA